MVCFYGICKSNQSIIWQFSMDHFINLTAQTIGCQNPYNCKEDSLKDRWWMNNKKIPGGALTDTEINKEEWIFLSKYRKNPGRFPLRIPMYRISERISGKILRGKLEIIVQKIPQQILGRISKRNLGGINNGITDGMPGNISEKV